MCKFAFMRKFLVYLLLVIILLLATGIIIGYTVLNRSLPNYNGEISLVGLESNVKVQFDEFGIPHIQANSANDAYKALGYLHAQERLFQMQLLRHAGDARLCQMLGADLLSVDQLFCTMGLREYADQALESFTKSTSAAIQEEVQAYMDGINLFIAEDRLPPEFKLLGSPCEPFQVRDAFCISNYMAFSFALGQRTDPLVDWISKNLGQDYLNGIALNHYSTEPYIPVQKDSAEIDFSPISTKLAQIQSLLPCSPFEGSNSWAVSSSRTKSGFPLFCNDTHMRHGMPSVWYETQLSYPGFELYGNHIPGIPYALVGHSAHHAWGLTMLEQDDLDFYSEEISADGKQVKYKGSWVDLQKSSIEIVVKDAENVSIEVTTTPHGPLVQNLFEFDGEGRAVSLWWDYTKHENRLLEAVRAMHHAQSIQEFEKAVAEIHGPGLNVQYADNEDNIAWWAAARLLKRPNQSLSKLVLDGGSGENDPLGYFDFSENPKDINPKSGIIYSANDQIGPIHDTLFYPGYYKPHHRGERIHRILSSRNDWDVESMKSLINDIQSDVDADLFSWMKSQLITKNLDQFEQECANSSDWDGKHQLDKIAPTIYYKWLYHVLNNTLGDELGPERFSAFLGTHWMKRAYPVLLKDPNSIWWDNIESPEKETLQQILTYSFKSTIVELEVQFGNQSSTWTWNKARHIELAHPMGKVRPLNLLFNVGPAEIAGGHETISQTGFVLNGDGFYPVLVGPQMRIVHDLSDVENSWSALPSGQSGHPLSPHYDDQFEMYIKGEFRKQHFKDFQGDNSTELVLIPAN